MPGGLEAVSQLARQLNADLAPRAALGRALAVFREALDATRLVLWIHQPNSTQFEAVELPAPSRARPAVPSLGALPSPALGAVRVVIVHAAELLGALELEGPAVAERGDELRLAADILGPFLASMELAEDLADEVAARARETDLERRLTALIIDSLPVGLYVVDREYRIVVWNRTREAGTRGLPRGQVVGRSVFEVLRPPQPELFRAEFDQVFRTGLRLQGEVDVERDGELRTFRSTKIPMRLAGDAISHVIVIGEDISEWRAIQDRILQSEKLAAVGQLAAGVMHEINNPLATIGACVAALETRLDEIQGPGVPAFREYLPVIDQEVERCTRIIDGLLDFSRPKNKRKGPVELNGLVEEALGLLRHHERTKKMRVSAELEPGLGPALGNREQLVQVVLALCLNALDAMDPGGALTVRTGRARSASNGVMLEVEDTGPGIPRHLHSKIFEPFYTTKAPGRGTGLGLSICYGIVEEHQGRLEVESVPGRGAVFRVSLPVAEAAGAA